MNLIEYKGDDQHQVDGNVFVLKRDGGGDFLLGVRNISGGINNGTHYVRFRRANGGASKYPKLLAALAALEEALFDACVK